LGCYALLAATVVLLAVFVYLPVFWAFTRSLYQFEVGGEAKYIGLLNYAEFFTGDLIIWPSFVNMILFTLIAVCVRLTIPVCRGKAIYSFADRTGPLFLPHYVPDPIVVPGVAIPTDLGRTDLCGPGPAQRGT